MVLHRKAAGADHQGFVGFVQVVNGCTEVVLVCETEDAEVNGLNHAAPWNVLGLVNEAPTRIDHVAKRQRPNPVIFAYR